MEEMNKGGPVQTIGWKVGDALTEEWLRKQTTYIYKGGMVNSCKSFHGDRKVEEVDNGWAKISGTSMVYLSPKTQISEPQKVEPVYAIDIRVERIAGDGQGKSQNIPVGTKGTIISVNGKDIQISWDNGDKYYCLKENLKLTDTRKKLSFTTEDGYDLYEGDKPVWVQYNPAYEKDKWYIGWECSMNEEHKKLIVDNKTNYRVFHSQETTEKWVIAENQKIEDAKKLVDKNAVIYQVGQWIYILDVGQKCSGYKGLEGNMQQYDVLEIREIDDRGINSGLATYRTQAGWITAHKQGSRLATMEEMKRAQQPELWSIVCTDGVRVYEDSVVYWLYPDGKTHFSNKHGDILKQSGGLSREPMYPMFSTYESAEEYRQKQCGEVVDKYPEETAHWKGRKWRIGDRFRHSADETDVKETSGWYIRAKGNMYTMETADGKDKMGSYTYRPTEIDKYIADGTWIPIQNEPIPVTKENAVVGMKVTRAEECRRRVSTPDEIGVISRLHGNGKEVSVKWPSKNGSSDYTWGNLWIVSEETIINQSTNNQNTKTQDNGNNQESISKDSSIKESNNTQTSSIKYQPAKYIRVHTKVVSGQGCSSGKVSPATYKVKPQVTEGYHREYTGCQG